jgi:DNA polymerase-1
MVFISSDLGQIEPRLIAHASEDQALIQTFRDGLDIYSVLGKALFNLKCSVEEFKESYPDHRQAAKTLALACFYGVGANKFKEQIFKDLKVVLTYTKAKEQIDTFLNKFPGVSDFKSVLERGLSNQRKLYNLLGRPIYMPSNDDLRKSLNLYIQGSASDLLLTAAFKFISPDLKEAGIKNELSMAIHDQLVFSVDKDRIEEASEIIKQGMTTKIVAHLDLLVPLKTDILVSDKWVK